MKGLDVQTIKRDFPIFKVKVNGKKITYLDSAATSQKPISVINAISDYYKNYNSGIGHGAHSLSEKATEAYMNAKGKVAKLINAESTEQIIYTKNTTDSLNLVAQSWGEHNIGKGDHILLTELEHHSNIIPWLMLAKRKGAIIDYIKLDKQRFELNQNSIEEQIEKSPKIVSISQCSNVLGTISDVRSIAKMAHKQGSVVMIDGAQSVPHMETDVQQIDCDFLAFSGHKVLGPTGIGVLYGKRELLESMQPLSGGCHMAVDASFHGFNENVLPWKLEAGTANIEGGIVLGTAIDYLKKVGLKNVREHEKKLTKYALTRMSEIKQVSITGLPASALERRTGIVSFEIDGVHMKDIMNSFDKEGIAMRVGYHCAMPLVKDVLKKKEGVARISFYLYTSEEDIDKAIAVIGKMRK
ncbi:MAG: aminotransferase class V-fold PLP-dependent enzyme [Candidatus Micrarchaeales archaeon]